MFPGIRDISVNKFITMALGSYIKKPKVMVIEVACTYNKFTENYSFEMATL